MAVCLNSNYGKTLRISSVPCMSGTMNFCVAGHVVVATEKFIVPEDHLESQEPSRVEMANARHVGVGVGVWPRHGACAT